MSFEGILLYSARALRFAMVIELLWLLLYLLHNRGASADCRTQSRKQFWSVSLLIFYLAALVQITVIRGGIGVRSFLAAPHDGSTLQLVPLLYTLQQIKNGWWAFVYPVCGNIGWFVPLGILLPWVQPKGFSNAAAVGLTALLLSCSIELLQWIFGSGVSDVDDVILNVLGALLGYFIWKWTVARRMQA